MPDLDHPFADDLNWLLHRVGWAIGNSLDALTRERGLSIREFVVLRTVVERPGLHQFAMGRALGLDKTAVTAVVDRLEVEGLIRRTTLPTDRRVRVAEPTERGVAVAAEAQRAVEGVYDTTLADVSDRDRKLLIATLRRLASDPLVDSAPHSGSCI